MVSLREEVVRLTHLIDDLHLVALSELSTFPCTIADTDAAALVRNMVNGYTLRAQTAGITLESALAQDAAIPVRWDAGRIEQLLRNLLENSLRYTDAPGRVRVSLASDGALVTLTVDDSAPGVSEAEAERIFLPLHRTESARARNAEGSGLGLAICQVITQSHGGSIRASSSELGGIRMEIHLPVHGKDSI
jgi:two-component system sensor histidine kinase BaeS